MYRMCPVYCRKVYVPGSELQLPSRLAGFANKSRYLSCRDHTKACPAGFVLCSYH